MKYWHLPKRGSTIVSRVVPVADIAIFIFHSRKLSCLEYLLTYFNILQLLSQGLFPVFQIIMLFLWVFKGIMHLPMPRPVLGPCPVGPYHFFRHYSYLLVSLFKILNLHIV